MAKCKFCGGAVTVAPTFHEKCWEKKAEALMSTICDKYCVYPAICGEDTERLFNEGCCDCKIYPELLSLGK